MLDAGFMAALRSSAVGFMAAQVSVYRLTAVQDTSGVETEAWPGMAGQPAGAPALVLPGMVQFVKRIPIENEIGLRKLVVGMWIIKLPVVYSGAPVVVYETDRFSTADSVTGAYSEFKASNVYQGRSNNATIDVYCEKIV